MSDPNSFGNPEFLKDLEFINDQLSKTAQSQHPSPSQGGDATKVSDALTEQIPEEELRLTRELEQACLDTGATGAAIALARGEEMVCYASAGPQAPGKGVRLDPGIGLSGSCIQTRKLQQCTDTQTDSRVDAEACRRLGVRSIVVLPLVDGNRLFGVFEILSSRPNAFSQLHLDSLRVLADRIIQRRKQNRKSSAAGLSEESVVLPYKLEEIVRPEKGRSLESASEFPLLAHKSRKKNDRSAILLGVLVIAAAMLLGMLVGWRLGWQKATLGFRASSRFSRAHNHKNGQPDHLALPANDRQLSSTEMGDCGQSESGDSPTQPLSGGLTVCQEGRVIFRLRPSAIPPIRDLPTSRRSPGVEANITQR